MSVETTLNQPVSIPVDTTETATGFYTNGITVETTDIQPDSLLVETTTIETPLTVETTDNAEHFTMASAAPTEPLQRDAPSRKINVANDPEIVARVLALDGLSEKKAAAQLNAEGIKIGARSVGTIRKQHHTKDAGAV
ncbi:hypothetical protein [uncultured Thiocystis sp.]|uniref:hypothetical protein n=1 Tax=uncultured Thiocystis sp. TaxID=1202134 RepID=UPI0025D41850|nr:hypothetical protein [uncultured Thiocystis sp.]